MDDSAENRMSRTVTGCLLVICALIALAAFALWRIA